MSNKTVKKVKVPEGYSCIVAPIEMIEHIVETYVALGNEQEDLDDKDAFYSAAALFQESLEENINIITDPYEDYL